LWRTGTMISEKIQSESARNLFHDGCGSTHYICGACILLNNKGSCAGVPRDLRRFLGLLTWIVSL